MYFFHRCSVLITYTMSAFAVHPLSPLCTAVYAIADKKLGCIVYNVYTYSLVNVAFPI